MPAVLKERRNEVGKDLKEIAEVTRIKCSYLRAIEEGEFDKLPAEVYARGYIREYAQFLGIPPDIALEPYEKYLRERKGAKEKGAFQEKTAVFLTKEVIENPDSFKEDCGAEDVDKLFPPEVKSASPFKTSTLKILWVVPVIAVAAGIYFVVPAIRNSSSPSPQPDIQIARTPAVPSVLPPVPDTGTAVNNPLTPESRESGGPSVSRGPDKPAGREKPPVPGDITKGARGVSPETAVKPQVQAENGVLARKKHMLKIDATGKVWVKVVIDGKENKELLLHEGDGVSYGANESIVLTVGNAAGAKINFDGKPFENLGDEGQVVKLNFPPEPSGPESPAEAPEKPQE